MQLTLHFWIQLPFAETIPRDSVILELKYDCHWVQPVAIIVRMICKHMGKLSIFLCTLVHV